MKTTVVIVIVQLRMQLCFVNEQILSCVHFIFTVREGTEIPLHFTKTNSHGNC